MKNRQEKVMIEIRLIDSLHKADINIPNEPYEIRGRMFPSYNGEKWDYTISSLPKEKVTQIVFRMKTIALRKWIRTCF